MYKLLIVVITIGMDEVRVRVDEGMEIIEICASIIEGDLRRDVLIAVAYQDRGATG